MVDTSALPLIPGPRCLRVVGPGVALPSPLAAGDAFALAGALRAPLSAAITGRVVLGEGLAVTVRDAAPDAGRAEAYALRVSEAGVDIAGATPAARLHALQTLAQLLHHHREDATLPGYEILDWPDLALRGVHACYHLVTEFMPVMAPHLEGLLERISLVRHYKGNAMLLEAESLFPYERHPRLASPLAFTREEWQRVARHAEHEGVAIIPLVQCLGHAYNVLRHAEYAHLREVPRTTQQYCPTNPALADFYMELVDEYLALFPGLTMFHVGGDESRRLGVCPRCKAKVAERGLGALYGEHVGEICRRLLGRGVTPLVWADIIEHAPDAASYLPAGTVLVYWNYDLQNWSRKPAFEPLEATGHPIITASAARFGTHNHTMYLYSRAMAGVGALTRETARRGYGGTLVTDWMKVTPYELSAPALAYGLAEAWHGAASQEAFERAFAREYHGLPAGRATDLARLYRLLEPPVPFMEDGQTHMVDRLDRYDLSGLSVRERLARYAAQDGVEDALATLNAALARGREALTLAEGLAAQQGLARPREVALLRHSARTQVHKARMGIALLEAARLLRYPTPEDEDLRAYVLGEFDALIPEWEELREEARALLLPSTFAETVERSLDVRFEPDARAEMVRLRDLLARGEQVLHLF